jgi:hypothetical protein
MPAREAGSIRRSSGLRHALLSDQSEGTLASIQRACVVRGNQY